MVIGPEAANVFELDPALAALLRGPRAAELRSRGRVVTHRMDRGPVDFRRLSRVRGMGLLVVEGFFARKTTLAGRSTSEIVGHGDVLRPWDAPNLVSAMPLETSWRTVETARIAVLDAQFLATMGPWPEVAELLATRMLHRSRWAMMLVLLGRLPWTEARILVLFWHIAERWGRPLTDGGILLPLRLTNQEIGHLVSAQRPTTTMALNHLRDLGRIERRSEGWVVHGTPPTAADLERETLDAAFQSRRNG